MPDELCPKCNAMMVEVMKQLIIPEKLAESERVAAAQAQMECPDCHFAGEPYMAPKWTGIEANGPVKFAP